MRFLRIPSKKVCRKFHLTYELKGAQKGVDVLTKYYKVRRMKVVLNGIRVVRGYDCDYFNGIATFTKVGLNRENVLHELYHHLVDEKGFEITESREEREAYRFVREILKRK